MSEHNEAANLGVSDTRPLTGIENNIQTEGIVVPITPQSHQMATALEADPEKETRLGFGFDEQTERVKMEHGPPIVGHAASERAWNMQNFFQVPVRVASGSWTTAQLPDSILYRVNLPGIHQLFSRWRSIFEQYSFFKYRVRLRVELNGTAFHAGKLALYFRPWPIGATLPTTASRRNIIQMENVAIYPAYNTVGEIESQWLAPWEYAYTYDNNNIVPNVFGEMGLMVFNRLAVGAGSSAALNWTIYAQLLDVELHVPRPLTGSAQGLLNITNVSVQGNAPIDIKGDSYDTQVSGLDLPSNLEDPKRVMRSAISNPFMVAGHPPVDRLSAYPSSMSVPSQYNFERDWDEMEIDKLKRIWSFYDSIDFSTTNTFGQILYRASATPARDPRYSGTFTTTEWLSSFFANWRGDMEYCIEIIGTQYHTGKLFFGINYSPNSVVNFSTTGIDPTTYYGKVIELNKQKNCFKIRVPYQNWAAWCETATHGNASGSQLPNGCMRGPTQETTNYSIGEWFIAVLNPLVVPSGVTNAVNLNIYVRGAENLEWHRLVHNGMFSTSIAQADNDEIGNRTNAIRTNTVSQFVERPLSLKEVLKRAVCVGDFLLTPVVGTPGFFYSIKNLDEIFRNYTPYSNIVKAYCGYYGDIRVKIVAAFKESQGGSNFVKVGFINRYAANSATSYTAMMAATNAVNMASANVFGIQEEFNITAAQIGLMIGGPSGSGDLTNIRSTPGFETTHLLSETAPSLEIEIPYYARTRYVGTISSDANDTAWGRIYFLQTGVAATAANSTPVRICMYMYAGDGLRCGIFKGTPNCSSQPIAPSGIIGLPGRFAPLTAEVEFV